LSADSGSGLAPHEIAHRIEAVGTGDRLTSRPRSRFSYANVTATLALFIALGGGAYAALKLPANSVGTKQLKDGAVGIAELKPKAVSTLSGADGPQGLPGPQGPTGPGGVVDPAQTTQRRVFSNPGVNGFDIPAGRDVTVEMWGAGGGGGGIGTDLGNGGGGGGSGAYSRVAFSTTAETSCNASVGLGGAAGSSNVSGTNGGASMLQCVGAAAAVWTALGGGGGVTGNLIGGGGGGGGAAGVQSPSAPYFYSTPGLPGGDPDVDSGGDAAARTFAGHGGQGGGDGGPATAGANGRIVVFISPAP